MFSGFLFSVFFSFKDGINRKPAYKLIPRNVRKKVKRILETFDSCFVGSDLIIVRESELLFESDHGYLPRMQCRSGLTCH